MIKILDLGKINTKNRKNKGDDHDSRNRGWSPYSNGFNTASMRKEGHAHLGTVTKSPYLSFRDDLDTQVDGCTDVVVGVDSHLGSVEIIVVHVKVAVPVHLVEHNIISCLDGRGSHLTAYSSG